MMLESGICSSHYTKVPSQIKYCTFSLCTMCSSVIIIGGITEKLVKINIYIPIYRSDQRLKKDSEMTVVGMIMKCIILCRAINKFKSFQRFSDRLSL